MLAISLSASFSPAFASDPPKDGYLNGAPISIEIPAAPSDPEIIKMDLAMVRAAQVSVDGYRLLEAYEDASNYNYNELLPRFSLAAGAPLTTTTRPILALMLHRVLEDTKYYVGKAKDLPTSKRPRPFVEDPGIYACYAPYLQGGEYQSYPSGHATNGYGAALLLSSIMPERTQPLLARGIRYGENRVLCGVHHPIDTQQGRLVAIAYFANVKGSAKFLAEQSCAVEEHKRALAGSKAAPFSPSCAALNVEAEKFLKPQKP